MITLKWGEEGERKKKDTKGGGGRKINATR